MHTIRVNVTVKVPNGFYCNFARQKSTPTTRCRFCTEIQKGIFVCVLYNAPLLVEAAVLILKTQKCCNKEGDM